MLNGAIQHPHFRRTGTSNGRERVKQCYPLGSSYLVGRVSVALWNSLSLTLIPFVIYFLCFLVGVTFPLVAFDEIISR